MWTYPNQDSSIRPIPHQFNQITIPIFRSLPTLPEDKAEISSDELQTNKFEENKSDFEGD